jgi:peptidoglycan/LPS O-acetylase OafA/YrhL
MQKPDNFTALNGLRFLAALAVVFFHFTAHLHAYTTFPAVMRNVISEGPAAVPFFFILSGFVLACRHLRNGEQPKSPRAFYWGRFLRLYPAYIFAFALFLPIAIEKYLYGPLSASGGRHTFIESAVLSGFMLQAWTPLAQAWNGPSWSLSVEAFMYLMFPLIGFRLINLSFKKTIGILFMGWLVPVGLACAYVLHLIPANLWKAHMRNNPLLWMPMFIAGICATKLLPSWAKVNRRTANIISTGSFALVVVLAAVWPSRWSEIFITGGFAPLLIVVLISFTRESGLVTKLFGGAVMDRLGQASYVTYIIQSPMWRYWQVFTNYLRHAPPQTSGLTAWQFCAFVPFLIVASLAVQNFVEIPLRGWIKEKSTRLSAPRAGHDLAFKVARRMSNP